LKMSLLYFPRIAGSRRWGNVNLRSRDSPTEIGVNLRKNGSRNSPTLFFTFRF
jgi:hypothetical protein